MVKCPFIQTEGLFLIADIFFSVIEFQVMGISEYLTVKNQRILTNWWVLCHLVTGKNVECQNRAKNVELKNLIVASTGIPARSERNLTKNN